MSEDEKDERRIRAIMHFSEGLKEYHNIVALKTNRSDAEFKYLSDHQKYIIEILNTLLFI